MAYNKNQIMWLCRSYPNIQGKMKCWHRRSRLYFCNSIF